MEHFNGILFYKSGPTMGPFINYVRVSRGEGVGKISTYSYLEGEGGQIHSYVIFYKSIFYIRNRAVKWFGREHISFASGR